MNIIAFQILLNNTQLPYVIKESNGVRLSVILIGKKYDATLTILLKAQNIEVILNWADFNFTETVDYSPLDPYEYLLVQTWVNRAAKLAFLSW